jgi:hypothetical protein
MESVMQLRYVAEPSEDENRADPVVTDEIAEADYDDGLLRAAMPIMIAAYGAALAIASFTFWHSGETLLSLAICVAYAAMFFGVPVVMARIRNTRDVRWSPRHPESRSHRVTVFSGSIERSEALLQMVIVPLAVAFAFAAFAVIWLSLHP